MKKTFVKLIALAMVAALACIVLASCGGPNTDPDKALESLEKNDYVAEKVDSKLSLAGFSVLGIDDLDCVVTGVNEDGESIIIFYFEDAEAASDEWDDIEKYAEELKEEAEDENIDLVVKQSGKMIYVGSKAAIKAAK